MAEWVIAFIGEHGYLGIAALMVAENLFPPIPSELIMPFAGFEAARGHLHWAAVILSGTAGSVAGTLPWYFAGRVLGLERTLRFARSHGRWLTLSSGDVERAERTFVRHGPMVLVLSRLVPALRTVISLPAGISKLGLAQFCAWTAVGSMVWCCALTAAGYLLESQYARIAQVMNPVSTGIVVVLVAGYLWRVIRFEG